MWSRMVSMSLGTRQPGESLTALSHCAYGHYLQPVKIREPARIGMIGSAQPERLKLLAYCPVRICRLRLDPGADDIADKSVQRRRDPRVVPRIPLRSPRSRCRPREDRAIQPVDSPRTLPSPPARRCVEATGAR